MAPKYDGKILSMKYDLMKKLGMKYDWDPPPPYPPSLNRGWSSRTSRGGSSGKVPQIFGPNAPWIWENQMRTAHVGVREDLIWTVSLFTAWEDAILRICICLFFHCHVFVYFSIVTVITVIHRSALHVTSYYRQWLENARDIHVCYTDNN